MRGAQAILHTLADSGVEVCFSNPGTSEMQMVAAFDREPRVRPVLCLFEGVATGAADGYARMAGKPATTLLHLGPGLGNGLANLHNARRALSPVVNLVGDHATYHRKYDAPLASDIAGQARTFSKWVQSAETPDDAVRLAAEAVGASLGPPAGVATLVLPADVTWTETDARTQAPPPAAWAAPDEAKLRGVAQRLKAARGPAVLLGSSACGEAALAAAARLAAAGVKVMCDTFVARMARGGGRFEPERVPYFGAMAIPALAEVDVLATVHSKPPASFFAYPNAPSAFLPAGAESLSAAEPDEDPSAALTMLADFLGAPAPLATAPREAPPAPTGDKLNAHTVGAWVARLLPEGAIVSEDAATSGLPVFVQAAAAAPHDWLFLTGGAIGQGLPVAVGAAVAAPGRRVVCLMGDGAAAYTPQALWTMARERLDVTVVVYANQKYRILGIELDRTESGTPGPAALGQLDLGDPALDWTSLARGFGVEAVRVGELAAFREAFESAVRTRGPRLIEVMLP